MILAATGDDIIDLFESPSAELSAAEVAARCMISVVVAERTLTELVWLGRLESLVGGNYRRAHETSMHLESLLAGKETETCAGAALATLAQSCCADAFIAVADRSDIVCIDYITARGADTHSLVVGERLGRCSAAVLVLNGTRRHGASNLGQAPAAAIVNATGAVRGPDGLAAPIADESGAVVAAIGIIAPTTFDAVDDGLQQAVVEAAKTATAAITQTCPLSWWRIRMLAASQALAHSTSAGAMAGVTEAHV